MNTQEHIIKTDINHFSTYAVMASTQPAVFSVTDLSITPEEVKPGEEVTITAQVTNTGDLAGSFEVILKINDVVKESKEVSLASGETKALNFYIVSDDVGIYSVRINNLEDTFKVVTSPDAFRISSLVISPDEVDIGEQASISVTVTNNSKATGTYEVILNIGGVISDMKEISLTGGASRQVTFTIKPDTAGKKIIDINGLLGGLLVRGEVPPPEQIPLPLDKPEQTPEPETIPSAPKLKATVEPVPTLLSNWWFIVIITGGCVVIAASLLYFTWWRKRRILNQENKPS